MTCTVHLLPENHSNFYVYAGNADFNAVTYMTQKVMELPLYICITTKVVFIFCLYMYNTSSCCG